MENLVSKVILPARFKRPIQSNSYFRRMRKWCIAVFIQLLLLSSCSTDFNVTTSWKDITIVYGLLEASDTAQYIKIGKAYLDPNTSALSIAQIPDSLYYNDVSVELEEYSNGNLVNTTQLEKVDGNAEGLVKDTGIFANSPNILYKTTQTLNQNSRYNLVVTKPDNGSQTTASTSIINDFQVQRPTPSIKVNLLPGIVSKGFVSWISAKDGKIYELVIRFNYREYNKDDPSQVQQKSVDWTIFTNKASLDTLGGETMSEDLSGDNFYTFLNSAIPDDQSVFRTVGKLDFLFSVGGQALDTYNQVTIAQQGLTSGQVLPTYTNINNGLGLLSSRFHKTVAGVPIDSHTVDSIACYGITSHLNFLRSDSTYCH